MQLLLGQSDAAKIQRAVKVLVLRTGALFGHDDGRLYAKELCKVLGESGHTVESTSIPFFGAVSDVMSQSVAYRVFDLGRRADVCVTIGPFSHAFLHHDKRVWLVSQYAPLYQHWNTRYGASEACSDDRTTREFVLAADRDWLAEARVVCAASETLSHALKSQGTEARLLPPALPDEYRRASIKYGDYFLVISPLADDARLSLVVSGFEKLKGDARLVIIGFERTPYEREHVEQIVSGSTKADLITLEIDPSYDHAFDRVASALALVTPRSRRLRSIFSALPPGFRKTRHHDNRQWAPGDRDRTRSRRIHRRTDGLRTERCNGRSIR